MDGLSVSRVPLPMPDSAQEYYWSDGCNDKNS